jgi:transposase
VLNENDEIKAQVASQAKVVAQQGQVIESQKAQLEAAHRERDQALAAVAKMQQYIRGLLRDRFGRATERLLGITPPNQEIIAEVESFLRAALAAAAQAESDSNAPVVPAAPATAPETAISPASPPVIAAKAPKRRGTRQKPSVTYPALEVKESISDVPEQDRIDSAGQPMVKVGEEITEEVVLVAPEVFIKRTVHPRYRSTQPVDDGQSAERAGVPVPERIVDGGFLSDGTVHALLIGKCGDATPCNRTLEIMARAGCRLSSSVVDQASNAGGDLLIPMAQQIRQSLRSAPVVGVDASHMRCRDAKLHRKCRRTLIYTVTDGTEAWYHWAPDETHAHGAEVLAGFHHWTIADAWPGWPDALAIGARLAGCIAHARRPFARIEDNDRDAATMVKLIAELYAIEDLAHSETMTECGDERSPNWESTLFRHRRRLRDHVSRGIMERIRAFALVLDPRHPGATGHPCGSGSRYILNNWYELIKFLDHPELRLDNNLAEGDLRMVALIRKNSLFLGAESAGPRMAASLSVIRSCRLARVNPHDYLADVTPVLIRHRRLMRAKLPTPDLENLTPKAWARDRQKTMRRVG